MHSGYLFPILARQLFGLLFGWLWRLSSSLTLYHFCSSHRDGGYWEVLASYWLVGPIVSRWASNNTSIESNCFKEIIVHRLLDGVRICSSCTTLDWHCASDQFCSLVFTLSNLYFLACTYANNFHLDVWERCGTASRAGYVAAFAVGALPLLVRLVQSIRRYYDSGLVTHLINVSPHHWKYFNTQPSSRAGNTLLGSCIIYFTIFGDMMELNLKVFTLFSCVYGELHMRYMLVFG